MKAFKLPQEDLEFWHNRLANIHSYNNVKQSLNFDSHDIDTIYWHSSEFENTSSGGSSDYNQGFLAFSTVSQTYCYLFVEEFISDDWRQNSYYCDLEEVDDLTSFLNIVKNHGHTDTHPLIKNLFYLKINEDLVLQNVKSNNFKI